MALLLRQHMTWGLSELREIGSRLVDGATDVRCSWDISAIRVDETQDCCPIRNGEVQVEADGHHVTVEVIFS